VTFTAALDGMAKNEPLTPIAASAVKHTAVGLLHILLSPAGWMLSFAARMGGSLVRWIPKVRAIDAAERVALKQIEAAAERDRQDAEYRAKALETHRELARLVLTGKAPGYPAAAVLKALGEIESPTPR
jgi:hypothetical protein